MKTLETEGNIYVIKQLLYVKFKLQQSTEKKPKTFHPVFWLMFPGLNYCPSLALVSNDMLGRVQVEKQLCASSSSAAWGSSDPHIGGHVLFRSIVADHM